jgi:hypothetical protein
LKDFGIFRYIRRKCQQVIHGPVREVSLKAKII